MTKNNCGKERIFFSFTNDSRPKRPIEAAPFDDKYETIEASTLTSFSQKIIKKVSPLFSLRIKVFRKEQSS